MKELQFERCVILKNNISVIDMATTLTFFRENMKELYGKYICVCNVHTTIMSYEDDEYNKVQNSAILNLPDGKPLSVIGHKKGYHEMGRVTGPDLMSEIFSISVKQKWRHFFYGSTKDTLKLLKDRLEQKYPEIEIAGMYAPPFRELSREEDENIVTMINDKQPDFIWVGLGAPKQEVFMYNHQNQFCGVMIGVGAGFNFHAGLIKRAPIWMQRVGLEWFYRMLQEPRRLWKRYMKTNWKFFWLIHKNQ